MEPQVYNFLIRQTKHEVSGKAIYISRHRFIQVFGRHPIQGCSIFIQHHPMATNKKDGSFYSLSREWAAHRISVWLVLRSQFATGP